FRPGSARWFPRCGAACRCRTRRPSCMPACGVRGGSLRPPDQWRHGREDRLDIAAGLQAEDGAAVVEQVELHIATAPDELLLAVGIGPGRSHIAADDLGIDAEECQPDLLGEVEIRLPIAGVEIVVEDAAD